MASGRGRIQGGIQAQAGNDGGMLPGCVKKIQCGERTVGHDDNGPSWQPSPDLFDHLTRPIGEGLVPFVQPLVIAFGGAQGGEKGSAQTRAAHGIGTSSIMHSQRKPLTLTK